MDLICLFRTTSNFGYYMSIGPLLIVSHRLTIFVITIVWFLSALISLQITTRDAHALNFDALVIDYSTWLEIQSTTTLLNHFELYNIPISLPYNHLMATDFWLNVPSETNVKSNYITNDFKVSNWLRADLGEIDLKGNSFPDYTYKSRTDLFDPSQAVIQKFTSIFLVIASILIIMLFLTCTGLVFLNQYVFQTVLQNCFRSDKTISWARTKKEIGRFSQFVLMIFIIIVWYTAFNATLLFRWHEYIVPIPTVIKIFSVFDINPVVWEENIEIGIFGDIGEEYEEWIEEKDFSPETGRFWQEILWNYWYILIAIMLYFGVSFYFSVFKLSLAIFMRYEKSVSRQRIFYYSIDQHRSVRKTLETDQSVCSGNNTENASKLKSDAES